MHECPACGQSCNCNGGDDLEEPAPDDCGCPCDLDGEPCPFCGCLGDCGCEDSAPFVCPGCHAVGGERCAPGCPDAAIEANRDACPACGGHDAHWADCPVGDEDDDD